MKVIGKRNISLVPIVHLRGIDRALIKGSCFSYSLYIYILIGIMKEWSV